MPLGFERLNERTSRPNTLINFIKPLPGPDETYARDFLERIAAICQPIMKRNYIAVMALEEYQFNREFIGRNFNAGEVIQLVLKGPRGDWMPFKHVQMVMIHELAHCKQMNHSKAFWKVRDDYANELRELWNRNYSGEGLWGRGQTLLSGAYDTHTVPEAVRDIDRLCGGTFGTRARKRKAKRKGADLSYAEKKQRRILRKFGAGGVSLGDDEDTRLQLEKGKRSKGKPRVAASARGRELRAAAALARFDKTEEDDLVAVKQELDSDSETESDDGFASISEAAIDIDGRKMIDPSGRILFNVCGAEDPDDDDVKREMHELFDFGFTKDTKTIGSSASAKDSNQPLNAVARPEEFPDGSRSTVPSLVSNPTIPKLDAPSNHGKGISESENVGSSVPARPQESRHSSVTKSADAVPNSRAAKQRDDGLLESQDLGGFAHRSASQDDWHEETLRQAVELQTKSNNDVVCSVCSLRNAPETITCLACSNVIAPYRRTSSWSWVCQTPSCSDLDYRNAADCGRCNLCGNKKQEAKPSSYE